MINVICGIIYNRDKIFIARRKEGKALSGKWEFPGGKQEVNESERDALIRELKEELGMTVHVQQKLGVNVHEYDNFSIELVAYKCNFVSASFELTDHDEYKWVNSHELVNYDLAEADIPFLKLI